MLINNEHRLGITRADWLSSMDLWLGLVVSSVLINLLSLAFPIALLQIYDRIVPNNATDTLNLLVTGVCIAIFIETLLRIARSWISSWADTRFEHLISTRIFKKILSAKFGAFQGKGAGAELDKLSSLYTLKDFYGGQLITTLLDVPFVLLFLALIAYIGGLLVIVPLGFVIFMSMYTLASGRYLKNALQDQKQTDDKRMNFIVEILGSIHTVKAFGLEAQMLRRYERLQENTAENDRKMTILNGQSMRMGAFVSQASVVLVVAFGCVLIIQGYLTLGSLAACTLLAGRTVQPINRAASIWARLQSIKVTEQRVQELVDIPSEEEELTKPPLPEVKAEIELRQVSFRHDEQHNFVLKDINLRIPFGQCIAIKGRGFSGRSTFLNLIGGLLEPSSGEVLVGGCNLSDYNKIDYRKSIGYLPEQGTLFDGTILDNITMFKGAAQLEEAIEIAEFIGLADTIEQMPDGYFTKVAQGTVDAMPRGLKQRITIARALLSRPPIILFDEANSALDLHGDEVLRNALEQLKGQCTLILVSHRPSTINIADKIYTLRRGELFEGEAPLI